MELFFCFGLLFKAIRAVTAAGLTAVSAAQVISLSEDQEWSIIVELAGPGNRIFAGLVVVVRRWRGGVHSLIVADCRTVKLGND
jgi:hypothetical protein